VTLLGARHVPERLCGGPCLQRAAVTSAPPLPFYLYVSMYVVIGKGGEQIASIQSESECKIQFAPGNNYAATFHSFFMSRSLVRHTVCLMQ